MSEAAIMAFIALVGSLGTMYLQSKYSAKFVAMEAKQKVCEEQDKQKGDRITALEGHIMTLLLAATPPSVDAAKRVEQLAKTLVSDSQVTKPDEKK